MRMCKFLAIDQTDTYIAVINVPFNENTYSMHIEVAGMFRYMFSLNAELGVKVFPLNPDTELYFNLGTR